MEFAEFENFMLTSGVLNKIPDEMDENLRDAFKILDKNNDGYIDKEELIFYMTKFGQQLVFKKYFNIKRWYGTSIDINVDLQCKYIKIKIFTPV